MADLSRGPSGWESLAGVLTSEPVVGHNADGRLDVFVRGTNGALFHRWQLVPGGAWADWESLGGDLTSEITVSRTPDGRLAVSARGTDGALWYIRQLSPSGTSGSLRFNPSDGYPHPVPLPVGEGKWTDLGSLGALASQARSLSRSVFARLCMSGSRLVISMPLSR